MFLIADNKQRKPTITSLCPTLGKRHSVLKSGMCPGTLQNPNGKEIPVSIVGPYPYMTYNARNGRIGGAAVDIIEVYAKKLNFRTKITKVPTYDKKGGKVDKESIINN